jgi:hypothetical protein
MTPRIKTFNKPCYFLLLSLTKKKRKKTKMQAAPSAQPSGAESPSASLAQPRQELEDLLNRKALVDEQIANIERQIYYLEGSYLEDTALQGNVIKGFEGYLTNRIGGMDKKKGRFKETDRLFSMSSSTYQKVTSKFCFWPAKMDN